MRLTLRVLRKTEEPSTCTQGGYVYKTSKSAIHIILGEAKPAPTAEVADTEIGEEEEAHG